MSKRLDLLAAAVLAVGGFVAAPTFGQADVGGSSSGSQQQSAQPSDSSSAGQSAAGQSSAGQPAAGQSSSESTSGAQTAGSSASAQQPGQSEMMQPLSKVVIAVLTPGQASNLGQQFSQADQDKLKDFKADQLDQSVQQLKQAYKDKYQKDLDLSQNTQEVFNQQFAQVGGSAEQARQASAQIGGESGAGAAGAGTSGAQEPGAAAGAGTSGQQPGATGAGTAGESAQTAGATSGQMQTITVPSSHGMPEAKLNLVKEGEQWKLQLPPGADAQQISQKLQQQVQDCIQKKDQWPSDATEAQRGIAHSVLIAFSTEPSSPSGAAGQSGTSGGTSGSSGQSTGTSDQLGGQSGGTSGSSGTSGGQSGGTSGSSGTSGETGQ
jgi:hypothetical protein